jgi:hypothetical protein
VRWLLLLLPLPVLAEAAMSCRFVEIEPVVPVYSFRHAAITVHWHGDYESMNEELTSFVGEHEPVLAWTQCSEPVTVNELTVNPCVIHAIPPSMVEGDRRMETLGHEFLHTVIGDFHQ